MHLKKKPVITFSFRTKPAACGQSGQIPNSIQRKTDRNIECGELFDFCFFTL